MIRDRALGALVGLAIGDALGTTLEFSARDSLPEVTDLVGGGPFHLEPGEWTDDTSMALCLADSLIACRDLDEDDLMRRFCRWYRVGENSVTGRCFDIGNTTRAALEHYERTGLTGGPLRDRHLTAGNGSLMRLAPIAIAYGRDVGRMVAMADRQSRVTHAAEQPAEACRLFAILLAEAMDGARKQEVLAPLDWNGHCASIARGDWRHKKRQDISSSGYCLHTLEAAVWGVGKTASFAEAVILATNLGDDADTVAAVTGQLAGALYGLSGIPAQWLDRLAWRASIEERAASLYRLGDNDYSPSPRGNG